MDSEKPLIEQWAIVLDTNVLIADFRLKSSHFRVLAAGALQMGHTIVIPEVVALEAAGKFVDAVLALRGAEQGLRRDMTRLGLTPPPRLDDKFWETQNPRFAALLSNWLAGLEGVTWEIPAVPLRDLVARAIEKKPPFKDGSDGFRDFLIWRTVLEVVAKTKGLWHS